MYDFSQHDASNVATDDDEAMPPQTDEDVIKLIVEDRLWFDDRELATEALNALNKLVCSKTNESFEDSRMVAVLQGAPLAIAQVMRQNEDSLEIQFHACVALSNIGLCALDQARRDIIESGGPKACIRAVALFPYSSGLQATGCNMIRSLWWYSDVRNEAVGVGTEALTAVYNAMMGNKSAGNVQESGCYALVTLLRHESSSGAEATVNIGCIDAVIDSMKIHRLHANVQQYGCQFLGALAKSRHYYRTLIIDAMGLVAVAEARRFHKDNVVVARAAEMASRAIMEAVPARRIHIENIAMVSAAEIDNKGVVMLEFFTYSTLKSLKSLIPQHCRKRPSQFSCEP